MSLIDGQQVLIKLINYVKYPTESGRLKYFLGGQKYVIC